MAHQSFYVIIEDRNKFGPYDIQERLIQVWKNTKWGKSWPKPKNLKELEEWFRKECKSMWWARTEWEIVIHDWPCDTFNEKWDVFHQIEMNWDLAFNIFVQNIKFKPSKIKEHVDNN